MVGCGPDLSVQVYKHNHQPRPVRRGYPVSMMTLPRVALLPVAALALIGLLVPALSGCTATKRRVLGRTVAIANVESVVPERGPVNAPVSKVVPLFGVIVENANGSVIVIADPSVNVPEVRAKVYGLDDRESRRSGTVPAWVAASIEKYDNVNTLQVLAADPSGENRSVDLRVVVPATAFVNVNNSGGNIEITGIGGNLQISNGLADGRGGRVHVRTDKALKDGALIRVRNGDVSLTFGKGTAGKLDAKGRSVNIRTDGITPKGVIADTDSYQGELGSLGKDMIIRVVDGKLTLLVE
jgi:hypothetical protein